MTDGFSCETASCEEALIPLLEALAVLGRADAAALAALLDVSVSVLTEACATSDLAALESHPAVRAQDGWLALDPAVAAAILTDLERNDLPRYRQLHERAIASLADQLCAGNGAVEPAFVAAFDRLANRLLPDDPEGFVGLIASVRHVPLVDVTARQRRRYFEGLALGLRDRYAEALAAFDALLAEPALDEEVRARTLNSHAVFCRYTGRLGEAMSGYQASLEVWRRLGNRLREGIALLNLGIVAYQLQEYPEVERSLHQAASCFEETAALHWLAAAQNELGLVYRDRGQWTEALARFETAAAHYRAEGAEDTLGRVLNNIGEVLLFQGRLQEARAAFEQALAAMTTRTYAVDAHLNLGLTRQAGGDLTGARRAFQEALDLALAIGRRDILAQVHYRLGEALRQLGEFEAALRQFEAGAAVIEATREPLRDEGLKISLVGRWQQVYEALVLHCLALDRPAVAFAWAERARARAFADALMRRHHSPPADDRSADDGGSDAPPVIVATADEVQAALPADVALLCYFTTGVLEQDLPLLRALPAGGPLRAHLLTPARTLLFVLTGERLSVHTCPIDPNTFTTASPRADDRARFLAPAVLRRLHAALLAPAGEALTAGKLYLVPHGPLHHVPFAALADEHGRPLVHAGGPHLAYAPSATVLLRHCLAPGPIIAPIRPCLAVGYDGSQGVLALRHTEAEATFVASLTGGTAWVGPWPKKEQLRLAASDRRWLHFACHGRFDDEVPLHSYLETAPGERVTALEVLQSWRVPAELVTLSACQTGVSRVLRGDEPMGLVRAFLAAGARAALVSQWAVADLPAFLLMQHFYRELLRPRRGDPAAALHTAQCWLRELTTVQVQALLTGMPGVDSPVGSPAPLAALPPDARPFAHPRHWAAFVLVGG